MCVCVCLNYPGFSESERCLQFSLYFLVYSFSCLHKEKLGISLNWIPSSGKCSSMTFPALRAAAFA